MAKTSKAIRVLRAAMAPPSSGRKLVKELKAARLKISQPTLNQIANEVHPASDRTKAKLNEFFTLSDEDWS